jgi:LysM repeat protein
MCAKRVEVRQVELEDTECGDREWGGGLAALRLPERADLLDFSSIYPAVRMPTTRAVAVPQAPVQPRMQPERQTPSPDRRLGQASVRLKELATMRPMVRIPGKSARANDGNSAVGRLAKLPPVWLLANVVLMLVVGVAALPRIIAADAAQACSWHTVVSGDTLGNLGWANHTNALALARANHIADPNMIYVGQRLCIPLSGSANASSSVKPPSASHPPSFGTASNAKSFINFALPYARQAHQETGWPVSLILAQWGLEHGWNIPGFTGYNWGNSGAIPGFPTVAGTNVPGSPAAFAYARTPADGVAIYVHCAHLSYYTQVARAAASSGSDAAARALGQSPWDAGHYTAVGSPGSSLLSIMRVFNLYWYDTH